MFPLDSIKNWWRSLFVLPVGAMTCALLTRRRCAGCWRWAAAGTLWWRSRRCCCSSGYPGTVARRAAPPRTPWGRTPWRTAATTSPACPPPGGPPRHPLHRGKLRGVQGVKRWHLGRNEKNEMGVGPSYQHTHTHMKMKYLSYQFKINIPENKNVDETFDQWAFSFPEYMSQQEKSTGLKQ